jgi:hypothetical protein
MNSEKKKEKKSKAGKVFFEQRKTKDRSTVWNAHNAKVEVFSWLRIMRRDLYIKSNKDPLIPEKQQTYFPLTLKNILIVRTGS